MEYYLSPTGNDSNAGTISSPFFSLNKAWSVVSAGDTIYLRGGIYSFNTQQVLVGKSGTSGNLIKVWAYPGEVPEINKGTSYTYDNAYGYGCYFDGDYVHFKGLDISYFVQETEHVWHGLRAYGNNNIFELLNMHHNGAGMLLGEGCTGNLILNCDFHHNNDPLSPIPYNNGSGLSTSRNSNTSANNIVRGCRAWWNTDTGFDAYYNEGFVEWDSCWSFWNGFLPDTFTPTRPDEAYEGCGWKFGETQYEYADTYKRLIKNCVSAQNKSIGYTVNGGVFITKVYNCNSYNNGFLSGVGAGIGFELNNGCANTLQNNISYNDGSYSCSLGNNPDRVVNHNTFIAIEVENPDYSVTDADFLSVSMAGIDGARGIDGSLPDIDFLKLASGSDLIDGGIDVGLEYSGAAPDLGAFEYTEEASTIPIITTTSISSITSTTAKSGATIISNGGETITAKGVCWSTTPNPTTSDYKTLNGTGNTSFTSSLTGLTPNTLYYLRAYATNSVGTAYGEMVSFTTLTAVTTPTVSTKSVTSITQTSARCGGNVTSNGGATVTSRGICWSTSPNPTISNTKVTSGSGNGSFSATMAGLYQNTKYYVRAFATNSAGTSYGSQISFTSKKKW